MTEIYAHRGYSAAYPENTILAFEKALALGVGGIELDVHATADRVPVVLHDRVLSRTTNGSGNVDAIPLASLMSLDAGSGERIPTLAAVLELVADRVHLDIEVKGRGIEGDVLGVLARFPAARWAISSFNWDSLVRLRSLAPAAELWPLAAHCDASLLEMGTALGSPALSLASTDYTSESASAIREAGFRVMVWTVNDPDEARRVQELGAWAICTDDPARIQKALRSGVQVP